MLACAWPRRLRAVRALRHLSPPSHTPTHRGGGAPNRRLVGHSPSSVASAPAPPPPQPPSRTPHHRTPIPDTHRRARGSPMEAPRARPWLIQGIA